MDGKKFVVGDDFQITDKSFYMLIFHDFSVH